IKKSKKSSPVLPKFFLSDFTFEYSSGQLSRFLDENKKVRKKSFKKVLKNILNFLPKKKLLFDFTFEYSSRQLIRFPDEKIFPPPPPPPPPPLPLTPNKGSWAFTVNCSWIKKLSISSLACKNQITAVIWFCTKPFN